MRFLKRSGSSFKLPTLRFRAKIMLGFAVVLAISAASMGIAWLGFERVSAGVASYRHSVSEADRARDIDRELISYRALARYFVVTGREEDGKAALAAEAGLKDAIDQSIKGTANPARRDQVARLEKLGAKRERFVKRWWIMQAPTGHRFCVVDPQGDDFPRDAASFEEDR